MYGSHSRVETDGGAEGVGDLASHVLKNQSRAGITLPKLCNIWPQIKLDLILLLLHLFPTFCVETMSVSVTMLLGKLCQYRHVCMAQTIDSRHGRTTMAFSISKLEQKSLRVPQYFGLNVFPRWQF